MASPIPDDPGALLTRAQTGAALRAKGFPIADKTLATMASRGGGPPFQRFGRVPLYIWADTLIWARSRLTPPMKNTSAADASAATA
jgi:hypothetical protein